jgi:hypothetical protein
MSMPDPVLIVRFERLCRQERESSMPPFPPLLPLLCCVLAYDAVDCEEAADRADESGMPLIEEERFMPLPFFGKV